MKKTVFLGFILSINCSLVEAGLRSEQLKSEKVYFLGKISELKKNEVTIIGPLFSLTVKKPRFKLYNAFLLKNIKNQKEYKNYLIYVNDVLSFSKHNKQLIGVR